MIHGNMTDTMLNENPLLWLRNLNVTRVATNTNIHRTLDNLETIQYNNLNTIHTKNDSISIRYNLDNYTGIIDDHDDDDNINNVIDEDFHNCHPDNPFFNCSRLDYVKFLLGPQTLPLHQVLLITIIYGGIFITGILGNILVCVVIVRHSNMHTATNYYLFSLALSDLLYLLFGLPAEVFIYWHQYPYLFGLPFCKIRAYISEACTYVSVFTIVAFSVERYLAICHPLHTYAMSGFKRALRIILALWLVSLFSAIPFGLMTNITYSNYPADNVLIPESAFCSIETPDDIPLFEISFLIFFFIPMILIIYFYGRMSSKIRSRTTQKLGVQHGSIYGESRHQQSRKAVIRMLAAVVLTFFICGLPFHIQRLFFIYGKSYKYYIDVNEWLFSLTGFPYYIACTINPILYNLMSHRYRIAFKEILCGKHPNKLCGGCCGESFRDNTMASSFYNANTSCDRNSSIRSRSLHYMSQRSSLKSDKISWRSCDLYNNANKERSASTTASLIGTNTVVVCLDNDYNRCPKVFAEHNLQLKLLNKTKTNETCI